MKKNKSTRKTSAKTNVTSTSRKWLKLLHIVFSSAWFGGSLALITLIFFLPRPDSASALLWQHVVFHRVSTVLVATASVLSLLTGLWLCWKTHWGFFRHWWVMVKLFLTIIIIVFAILVSGPAAEEILEVSRTLGMEALNHEPYLKNEMLIAVTQSAISIFLVFMVYLSVFKPWSKHQPVK